MIARLYGTCQGQEIVFTQNGATGRWETTVPASPSGSYVLELWAEDTAGNVGYFATVRLAFDTNKLRFRVEVLDIGAEFSWEDVAKVLCLDGITACLDADQIIWAVSGEPVRAAVTEWEVCT